MSLNKAPAVLIPCCFPNPYGDQQRLRIMIGALLLSFHVVMTVSSASLLDESFEVGDGPGPGVAAPSLGEIRTLALEPDGRILVGGRFTSFNGTPCDGIVRLNTDGSVDGSFNSGSGNFTEVYAVLLQPDGKLLVGGLFESIYGKSCSGLVRLGPNGGLDNSFPCTSNLFATALLAQPDGKILIGGLRSVTRLLPDGQLDAAFAPIDLTYLVVAALVIQGDGKILVGGPPGNFGVSVGSKGLVRMNPDGSLDSAFIPRLLDQAGSDSLTVGGVTALALDVDGKILAGGRFSIFQSGRYLQRGLIRLNADGTLDASFPLESYSQFADVHLAGRADGRTLIASGQMSLDGVTRSAIAQILPGGILDVDFAADFAWDPEPPVFPNTANCTATALQSDGKVVVAGHFTSVDGIKRMGLARLHDRQPTNLNLLSISVPSPNILSGTLGSAGPSFIEANTNVVAEITRAGDPNRRIMVDYLTTPGTASTGEDFIAVQGTLTFESGERKKFVLIPLLDDSIPETNETFTVQLANPSEGVLLGDHSREEVTIVDDDGFYFRDQQYVVSESNGEVKLAVFPGQREIAFTADYETQDETAKADRDFGPQKGSLQFSSWWQDAGYRTFQVPIFDNAVVDGDRSFVVTLRNPSSGLPLGPNSSVRVTIVDNDTFAGPAKGVNGTIQCSAGLPDGHILIGGWFTAVDGLRRNYVARLNADGSVDPSFDPGSGPNGPVTALALQSDGQVIVGGHFTEVSGGVRSHIARLTSDGSLDGTFDPREGWQGPVMRYEELPTVRSIVIQPDGKILTAGSFTNYGGVVRRGLARVNPDGSLDTSFDPQMENGGIVRSLALQPDGKLIVGGSLTNLYSEQVMRLYVNGSTDESFRPPPVWKVLSLLLLANGQLLVGSEGGSIFRLNSDGSQDMSFPGGTNFSQTVYCLAELPDGKILAGGQFADWNTDPDFYTGLIRLTSSGVRDPTFQLATRTMWPPLFIRTLRVQAGGGLFLGGTFAGYDDEQIALARRDPLFGVAELSRNPDAYHWVQLNPDGGWINDLHFERLVRLNDGTVALSLAGQGRPGFVLEASESLSAWSTIATNVPPNAGLVFRDHSSTNTSKRFYRVH